MTVATEAYLAALTWTGAETVFTPGFSALDVADVLVVYRSAAGALSALTNGVHLTLSKAGPIDVAGSITAVPVAMPAAPGTVIFFRKTPATQATAFADLQDFSAAVFQHLADAAALRAGELRGTFNRSLLAPIDETFPELPDATARKAGGVGSVLGFDGATGAPVLVSPGSPIISLLTDYDEGNWTPVIQGTTTPGVNTYSTQVGRWIRVGNLILVSCFIIMSVKDAAMAGNIQVGGLPFVSRNITGARWSITSGQFNNFNLDNAGGWTTLNANVLANSNAINLNQNGDNVGAKNIVAADVGATVQIALNGSYFADVIPPPSVNTGAPIAAPQARVTLTQGVALPAADVATSSIHYFTPAGSRYVPVWDGSTFVMRDIGGELSQTTADATKSPAAVVANKLYDILVWMDGIVPRATRGWPWASDISRGAGAGTAELELVNGMWVNKFDVTNGPAARKGTLVGTVRSDGSALLVDTAAFRWVSNVFGADRRKLRVYEATASWTYNTALYRRFNNSAANQLDFVQSLSGATLVANALAWVSNSTGGAGITYSLGLDLDTLNTGTLADNLGGIMNLVDAGEIRPIWARWSGVPGLGRHTLLMKEWASVIATTTIFGTGGNIQSGVEGEIAL